MASKLTGDKICHRFEVFVAVVFSFDEQCRYFDPDARIDHASECVFDRFETSLEYLFVVVIVPAFEIDVGCV